MKRFLQTILSFLLLCSIAYADAGTTGKLTGRVTDAATGEALPFVNITIEGTNLGAATDIDGNYVILNIPPGKYNVKFQFIGYQPVVVEDVVINIDKTTQQSVQMSEGSVEMDEIVVTSEADVIKKDRTSSESVVSSDEIENLPVAELDDVLELQPGITKGAGGEFHIRGGRSSEISYWVNGISITDAYDNSRGIQLDNSSIQEVQVISGTFNAEYGNALSGIINAVTKEGGQKFHGDIKFYASDYVSDFTEYFTGIDQYNPVENYNIQGSLNGPVPGLDNMLRFFVLGRYVSDDGYLYGRKYFNIYGDTLDGELTSMSWSKRILGQANVTFTPLQDFKFNFEMLFTDEESRGYNHFYKWNPDGDNTNYSTSFNGTATMNHVLSNRTFYTLKFSYFNKEFESYLFEDPYDDRYMHPDSLNTINLAFVTKGTNLGRFYRETETMFAKLDFTSQVTDHHLIKLGVEGRLHTLRLDGYSLEPARDANGTTIEPFQPAIPSLSSTNRDNYDESPIEFSAYVQDKIEFEDVIINVGLRFDYLDSRGKILVDPRDPNIYNPLREGLSDLTVAEREPYFYKDATAKWQLSPRFGIAYPISETGVLHFSYGHFLQVPTFQYLFNNGRYKVPETGSGYGIYGNPDLKAQTTTMYEIGFRQNLFDQFIVDITAFYRDIRNWITAGIFQQTYNGVTYSTYTNKDYSNVRGITLNFSRQFSQNYSFDLSYTYTVAEGSNSNPEDLFNLQNSNAEPQVFLYPLNWDQRHLLNVSFYYGTESWGASVVGRYGTGLPYTPSITQLTATSGVSTGFQTNSRRRPAKFNVDLRLHKNWDLFGYQVTTFAKIFNLFDARNVNNVFGDTGDPEFTTEYVNVSEDPSRPNTIDEYINYPWHYDAPRLVQLGIEFSF